MQWVGCLNGEEIGKLVSKFSKKSAKDIPKGTAHNTLTHCTKKVCFSQKQGKIEPPKEAPLFLG